MWHFFFFLLGRWRWRKCRIRKNVQDLFWGGSIGKKLKGEFSKQKPYHKLPGSSSNILDCIREICMKMVIIVCKKIIFTTKKMSVFGLYNFFVRIFYRPWPSFFTFHVCLWLLYLFSVQIFPVALSFWYHTKLYYIYKTR